MELNSIYEGDNLEIMSRFPSEGVDFIYADPPFFSNKKYEVVWEDKAEVRSFEDRWAGGIEHYITWMEPRLRECHRILKKTGSIYLHCDWHANAHLKILMDNIFGDNNFQNEIVWKRFNFHADAKRYGNLHDILLFYTKSNKYTWQTQYLQFNDAYLASHFKHEDEKGKYRLDNLNPPGGRGPIYEFHGIKRAWRCTKEKMLELERKGLIYVAKGGVPQVKRYLAETKGQAIGSIWTDIPPINPMSKERAGYPTQKPIALLERMLKSSSNEGDIVFDPFCGCGTTLVAAQKLGRKWIGIDISPTACKLMKKRLQKDFKISALLVRGEVDLNYIRKLAPFEFQNWVVVDKFLGKVSERKSGDMGIDGATPQITGGYPIQVKQSEDIGRNVVDNFKSAIERVKKKKGYIVAYSFGKGAVEEVARLKNQERIEIILRTVKELLDGKIEDDNQHRLPVEPR